MGGGVWVSTASVCSFQTLIWASQQAVTWSDHLTIQTGHCPHRFKMVQQVSLSSWNEMTRLTHHGGGGIVRLGASPPSKSLPGPVALPRAYTQSPFQTLLKPLLPLFHSTNSKANKRAMLTSEWTASLVSGQRSGHTSNWKLACDVWKWPLMIGGDRLDTQPLSSIWNDRAENKASF